MIQNVFRLGMRSPASDLKKRQFHRQSLKEYELGPCYSPMVSCPQQLVRNTKTQTPYQTYHIRIFILTTTKQNKTQWLFEHWWYGKNWGPQISSPHYSITVDLGLSHWMYNIQHRKGFNQKWKTFRDSLSILPEPVPILRCRLWESPRPLLPGYPARAGANAGLMLVFNGKNWNIQHQIFALFFYFSM